MATGFLVVGPKVIGATDKEQLLVDVIDEQVDTIGKAFLGLTLGCARCHDHKFDPISARDYYALAGILAAPRRSTATCSIGATSRAGTCIPSGRAARPRTRRTWPTTRPSTT